MVAKVAGVWKVEVLGQTLPFVLAKGKLSVDGKPMKLMPAEEKEYPLKDGWFKYTPNSFIQITPDDIKVVAAAGEMKLPLTAKKPSGTWKVEMVGKPSTYVLVDGKLSIEGKPYKLTPSDDEDDYPSADGWFKYTPISYIQITANDINVAAVVGKKKLPVTVRKPFSTWMVETKGVTKTFVLAKGKLSVDGEHFELKPSKNKMYPATDGWLEYKAGSLIQISAAAPKVVLGGSEVTPITATKLRPIPADSKCL